ncbi:hypothetical protein J6590_089288 [Homalodisca vitripennis]|nr:hypothetical protein J6590_089288 [Homalodisca vitripennis]
MIPEEISPLVPDHFHEDNGQNSIRCCSQTIYLGVTESRNDTAWPDTGWSQQNQQIPQPAAAKAATGIGLLFRLTAKLRSIITF